MCGILQSFACTFLRKQGTRIISLFWKKNQTVFIRTGFWMRVCLLGLLTVEGINWQRWGDSEEGTRGGFVLSGLDSGMLEHQVSEQNGVEVNEVSANSSLALVQQAASASARYSQSDQFLLCPQALSPKVGGGSRGLMKKLKEDGQQCEPKRMATVGRKEVETIAVYNCFSRVGVSSSDRLTLQTTGVL